MSKERELLVHALDRLKHINFEDDHLTNDLIQTIQKYLAKPEQEPVAWMVETHFNNEPIKEFHTVKPMERVYKYCKVTELYSAPPKREPLINIYVLNAFKADDEATHPYSYWAGVEFAEKHHGIGGGE